MQDCMRKVETKAVMTVRIKFAILLIVSFFINVEILSNTLYIIGGYPQTPDLLLFLAQKKKQKDIHPI
jgi:hypothetical protein